VKAKLATGPPGGTIRSRVAAAEIETRQAGRLTLRLAYLVSGASWVPSYRATLEPGTGEVALTSEGVVRQRTGEDWSGVALRLSTAAPARGVAPPELASLFLRPVDASGGGGDAMLASRGYAESKFSHAHQNVLTLSPGAAGHPDSIEEITVVSREANVVHSAYNVAFEVPGRSDVPGDGTDHRVVLRQQSLPGTVAYRTAPAIEPAAFLTSVVRAPADYPLLAGPMRVLAGGAYLGVYDLPETAPGAELVIPFGRDNRIKIDRLRQPQERGTEGITGRTRQIAHAFKTTIENLRDREVTLSLEERLPVSEDERIVVEQDAATTPGHQPSKTRPGVLLWKLTLAPREKKDVVFAYAVRHPRDLIVPEAD
jgi:uncharacterized protein (TIGR02231 family)